MNPLDKALAELKRKLTTESELGPVNAYFFDHLGENSDFMDASEILTHPRLQAIVTELAKQVSPTLNARNCMTMLLRYKKTPFYHGSMFGGGCMGSVMYFEDIGLGCLSITGTADGQMHYLRFSSGGPPKQAGARQN